MAQDANHNSRRIKDSEQGMMSKSFDPDFEVLANLALGYDPDRDVLVRFKCDSTGRLTVTGSFSLPSGASTEAKQDTQISHLSTIAGKDFATSAKQDTQTTHLSSIDGKMDTQATATKQDTGNLSLSSIDTKVATSANQTTIIAHLLSIISKLINVDTADVEISEALPAGDNNIGNVDVASSALPTGASTSANQTNGSQKTQIVDGSGNVIGSFATDGYQALAVASPGHVSTGNSTATPLAGGATFTGTAEDITNFGVISIVVKASHASATDGLKVQYSTDGTNFDQEDAFTISADAGKIFTFQCAAKYFRVVYVNGSTLQTYFRLQTTMKPFYVKPSSHRILDPIIGQDDAELVKAVLTAQKPDTTFTTIDCTAGGNLKVSVEEFDSGASLPAGTNLIGSVGIDQTTPGTTEAVTVKAYNSKTTTYRPLKQDGITDALQTIDYSHHEIHSGSHYFYTDYDSDVDTAAPKYYRITTPNTTAWAHMLFTLYSEGSGTWQLYENPTINAAGTTATTFNNDRNSGNSAGVVVAYDATTTSDGTLLKTWRTGSGTTAPSRVGTESRNDTEIILKQNEDYVLKFTPDADNAKTKVELEWYEHTNL